MTSTVQRLTEKGFLRPPRWLPPNVHYETIMGSEAYGVSSNTSDKDIYGFCIPPKEMVFPHLAGEILGFGTPVTRFEQFQQHHIQDQSLGSDSTSAPAQEQTTAPGKAKQYDITIFNIVKYFRLAMDNNPNLIDSLFTSQTCVLHITRVGQLVREQRRSFLHKGSWAKFKGYAFSQLHKMNTKETQGKRQEIREQFGFDVKYAYHLVRLLYEAEQILLEGDIDLQRHREHLKAIRRGEVSERDIRSWAADKEKHLENAYHESKLPQAPDEPRIKQLLLHCLEEHYGNLEGCVVEPDAAITALREIQAVLDRYRSL
ncbi:MAG: DNA polymerase beta superfamily protein [Gemmataceae bacterium]